MIIKILIVLAMIAILFTLFRSLFFLATGKPESKKIVNGLTWRVALSIGLFVLIVISILMGWIEPHGLQTVKPQ